MKTFAKKITQKKHHISLRAPKSLYYSDLEGAVGIRNHVAPYFLAEVNYAELAGEGGEDDGDAPQESVPEPEESPKRKSKKSKKTKHEEDEEYQAAAEPSSERKRSTAGKPKKQKKKAKNEDDEEDDEDEGEGPALVDLFAVGPSLRFVAGATEATIYHIPKDVIGLIFSHVPVDTLLAMRHGLKSRYFKKDIDASLARMASAKFGVGADFRAW